MYKIGSLHAYMYGHTNLIALYYFDTDTFYYVSRTNYW